MQKIKEISDKLKTVRVLSILVGFSEALTIYIASSYFKDITGHESVGIFYAATYIGFLVVLLNLHKLVRQIGKSQTFLLSIAVQLIATIVMLITANPWVAIPAMMIFLLCDSLLLVGLDIILESFTTVGASGRIRGTYLMIMNIGFIIGPKLATWLLTVGSYHAVFLLVLVIKLLVLTVAYLKLGKVNHNIRQRETVGKLLHKALMHKDLRRIYYISFALEAFYALMVIYTSIYLLEIGLPWDSIGTIFTVMLLPFVFLAYPVGWLADKFLGEKEMIIFFLLWMAAACVAVFSLTEPVIWQWALVLLCSRIGAAAIATLRDSYFYKKIHAEDVDLIDFFRTAMPVAYIVSAGLSALLLESVGIHGMFIVAALIILSALYPALRLKDNDSEYDLVLVKHKVKA
jgi:MFS family permease